MQINEMTETANYRRLGRNGSSLFQRARSVSTFVLLVVVVICVLFAYQYMSNSAELNTFRTDFEQSSAMNAKLKNELLELNLKLEKLKLNEQQCRDREGQTDKKFEVCQTESEKNKVFAASNLNSNKVHCEKSIVELRTQLDSAKSQMQTQKQMHADQVANLTQTVEKMRTELTLLHNSHGMNDTNTATVNSSTDIRPQQQLTAPLTMNNNSIGSRQITTDDDKNEQQKGQIVGNGSETNAHSAKAPEESLQAKREQQHVSNDARERLDESEVQQQPKHDKQQPKAKENENEQSEMKQKRLMGAGGRVRLEEMAAEAAKSDGGGKARGELLQAAAAAQRKEENKEEVEDKEEEMPDKVDGEGVGDEPPIGKDKSERQQFEEGEEGERSKDVKPEGAIEAPLVKNNSENDDQ